MTRAATVASPPPRPIGDIAAILARLRSGAETAEQVAKRALAAARADTCNAFTAVFAERALAEARAVEAARAAGRDPGPLAGVPYAVKNLFDVAGEVTITGAALNRDAPPASADAAAVATLRAAGAILIGATNMDAFAYGYTSENTVWGNVRNPHDAARTAGGSSGGSAAAVAAGIVPLALGTDTNGSVRVPAALCGVCGLKPTFGTLDRTGVYPFVASLDHVGIFTGTARDMERVAAVFGLPAPATGLPHAARLAGWYEDHASDEANSAADRAARLLGATERVELPEAPLGRSAAFLITAAEAGDLHRDALTTRPDGFDPIVRGRLLAGAAMPAHWYLRAQKARARVIAGFARLLAAYDALILPATPVSAPRFDTPVIKAGKTWQPTRTGLGLMVQSVTLAGLPAIVVPCRAGPLPLGVQIVTAPGREDHALRLALALEDAGFSAPVRATTHG